MSIILRYEVSTVLNAIIRPTSTHSIFSLRAVTLLPRSIEHRAWSEYSVATWSTNY